MIIGFDMTFRLKLYIQHICNNLLVGNCICNGLKQKKLIICKIFKHLCFIEINI